eukprot:TRINITY_DN5657_c0_g1_i1.p1 TRINITY_DN5657_c0_g1~~TRINITY_DN5657_c0_g1_i1.p1  ORF type:complete len:110 (+),score=2.06 TRINITY_DN5657_c0_g1_i1:81-410(+)
MNKPLLQVITSPASTYSVSTPKSAQYIASPLPMRKKIPTVGCSQFKRSCYSTEGTSSIEFRSFDAEIPDPLFRGGNQVSSGIDHIIERSGAMNAQSRDSIFINQVEDDS